MSTTKSMISAWFDEGKEQKATHMIVVCDTFDYEDYPVFVPPGKSTREVVAKYDGKNMQMIMEVYDLSMDKQFQLSETRAFHY